MKKFLYIFPLSILCAGGIYINGAYYFQSYMSSGYSQFFSLGLAILFMLLEFTLWFYASGKAYLNILKFSIVIYSVTITMGAQYFSTSKLESEIAETIYVEVDTSGDVEYYRQKIDALDERLNVFIEQQRLFGSERSREEREAVESEKQDWIDKLEESQDRKQDDVQKINKPTSVYNWYAYSLPKIFEGEMSEDFIRVLFQLFSSILLALIAPISLTMIKQYKPATKQTVTRQVTPEPEEIKTTDGKPLNLNNVKWPRPKRLTPPEKSDILRMMYWYKSKETGPVLTPVKTSEAFAKMYKGKSGRVYTVEECQAVWDEIVSRGVQDSKYGNIKEELGL